MARYLYGGELPHAGEQYVVMRAGILYQDRAAARVTKNGCGNFYVLGGALHARRRDFLR